MANGSERFEVYTSMLADESVRLTASEMPWIYGITISFSFFFLWSYSMSIEDFFHKASRIII